MSEELHFKYNTTTVGATMVLNGKELLWFFEIDNIKRCVTVLQDDVPMGTFYKIEWPVTQETLTGLVAAFKNVRKLQ